MCKSAWNIRFVLACYSTSLSLKLFFGHLRSRKMDKQLWHIFIKLYTCLYLIYPYWNIMAFYSVTCPIVNLMLWRNIRETICSQRTLERILYITQADVFLKNQVKQTWILFAQVTSLALVKPTLSLSLK